MRIRFAHALAALVLGSSHAAATEADHPVPLLNAGFEEIGSAGLPLGWKLSDAPPVGGTARRDAEASHSGGTSVLLAADRPGSLTLVSEPVRLEVGRVYRLTGWLRTDRALSDPLPRYPTAVAACLTMASFPFTNHSPAAGGTRVFTRVETLFIATASVDRVRLHLGHNGSATGKVWFDDVSLAELGDIAEYLPPERVRWEGNGFRYEERGWIFIHAEGRPHERGRQFGSLIATELAEYARKLSVQKNGADPAVGWAALRQLADAMMFRRYDDEYLEEMKGIAEGAARSGAKIHGRAVDLLDVVTLNSVVDLGQLEGALQVTPHALSWRTFLSAEEEIETPDRTHKCSSLTATAPATADGRIVFTQLFMWGGYTGVHFNVILDLVPDSGHRLVFQTFPGGMHSGADFYINAAGIVIGETTVGQTPWNPEGTPQSNRIRKAAQYATSIDDVVRILSDRNNGLYTNDWTLADAKTDEAAILLLGTRASRLWRSKDDPVPFGTPGYLWANNNARDPDVRREYSVQADDAPFDTTFSPWNRDVAFRRFYDSHRGRIDLQSAVGLIASSPINRPHACDGKITTSEMAERMVFLAHQGKVTMREKFPMAGSRRMPDLAGATPHLTHGYAAFSPIWITEKLRAGRSAAAGPTRPAKRDEPEQDVTAVEKRYDFDRERLWRGTVFPESEADNWLASGSAGYWKILRDLPEGAKDRPSALAKELAGQRSRILYVISREDDLPAARAGVSYDSFAPYLVPRVKGTFALHQLRLHVGHELFVRLMSAFHDRYRNREASTADFLAVAREIAGRDVEPLIRPWLDRIGLPDPVPQVSVRREGKSWRVSVTASQQEPAYPLATTIAVETERHRFLFPMEIRDARTTSRFTVPEAPLKVTFDALNDVPVATERFHTFGSFAEDFDDTWIVYGTARQVDANRTLALRFQAVLADGFSELLPPVLKASEVEDTDLAGHDLFVLGDTRDNELLARLAPKLPVEVGPGWFRFEGVLHALPDEGIYLALTSPFSKRHVLHVFLANSPNQLHEMTKTYRQGLPAWAIFKGEKAEREGHFPIERFVFSSF